MDHQANDSHSQSGPHELNIEKMIDASPETLFDRFIAMYNDDRPDWIISSDLDLREGGRWLVSFDVPGGSRFREERVITALDRPRRLAYDMQAIFEGAPGLQTTVELTIEPALDGQLVRLRQQDFPTKEQRAEFASAWPDVLDQLASPTS